MKKLKYCKRARFVTSIVLAVIVHLAAGGASYATAGKDTRYIDFASGDDSNLGTRNAPWKHHPWDSNARVSSAAARGIHTYIFKKGVTYRGALEVDESGTKETPIRLTTEDGWGNGPAVLSGSVAYSDGWKRCPKGVKELLPQVSRSKTWCRPVELPDEPRLLWEVNDTTVTRIPIARTPNWSIVNLDDPRSEWYELDDVIAELVVKINNGNGFRVGESVSVTPRRPASGPRGSLKVVWAKDDQIRLEITNWDKSLLRAGDILSNGTSSSAKIEKIGGTHTIIRHLVDRSNLDATDPNVYKGATVWAERRNMPKADAAVVTVFDPVRDSLRANFHRAAGAGPRPHDRYYMEGLPSFLDSSGEYVYLTIGKNVGMLVLRLPGDRDPNRSVIEVAARPVVLKVNNKSHIEVSKLGFRFGNQLAPGDALARHASMYASAIQITGDVADIKINNCNFTWLAAGIVALPEDRETTSIIDGITISKSSFSDIDGSAIVLGNGQNHYKLKRNGSRLIHVAVQNNRLNNIGYRTLDHFGTGAHGNGIIISGGEVVDVSGNWIDRTWGSGISVTLGSDFERGQVERPFLRGLIHDNKIINSLLGAQDGGGINAWMGGPAYIYNNVSGNPVGCMYSRYKISTRANWYRRGCYGVGIYLDGQYKGYVFNNIVWGKNNNANDRIYNSVALNEAMGFMHTVFNNTFYRFSTGLHKGLHQHNRNYYLSNLFIDMGLSNIEQEPKDDTIDYGTLAFSRNQFYGRAAWFGKMGTRNAERYIDLYNWIDAMRDHKLMRHDTGTIITSQPVKDAARFDFMPVKNSPAIDAGARVFVPWALYDVVGEWHFLKRNDDPSIINGENINMDEEWVQRDMFDRISRNDLHCKNTTATDFVVGILEDWIQGALLFDGGTRYCSLREEKAAHAAFNVGANNFLIELVIAPKPGASGILEKQSKRGYSLSIDADGRVRFNLNYGSGYSQRISSLSVDDDKWHHVLVEVDRSHKKGISIYLDGELANGQWDGDLMKDVLISDMADLVVGRADNDYFSGGLDFLRISKGTLKDAETNIKELYSWEFDGPFLRDLTGQYADGARRDVGAVEYRRN